MMLIYDFMVLIDLLSIISIDLFFEIIFVPTVLNPSSGAVVGFIFNVLFFSLF